MKRGLPSCFCLCLILALSSERYVCAASGNTDRKAHKSSGSEGLKPGTKEWWDARIDEESKKAGRRVFAWEFDAPPGHGMYEDKTPPTLEFPDPDIDVDRLEPVPRAEMPTYFTPTRCGTLNMSHPAAEECFPPDGSSHYVCCADIDLGQLATESVDGLPDGPTNELLRKIVAASHPRSYSWCCCSHFICEELLNGKVLWDQHTLTHGRKFQEDLHIGLELAEEINAGWSLLYSGIGPLMELAENELDEADPWTSPGPMPTKTGAATEAP
eukprot:CAMPEP_0184307166 /NCGR_PEP_ID=MMETSP1049-20130417/15984_1 /TAXON_ID=77928 /ORGANISM="Proteomonas sulcata, Strain CCMP704" /LENGTH=269 /DNA_ID=CAMNT_0026619589 /DNA_START=73 /DNA_END=882 /DNA_ORIENTATION=+